MRSPHQDASIAGRRGCWRLAPLLVPGFLALMAGCATEPMRRLIEGETALAQLDREKTGPMAASTAPGVQPNGAPTGFHPSAQAAPRPTVAGFLSEAAMKAFEYA